MVDFSTMVGFPTWLTSQPGWISAAAAAVAAAAAAARHDLSADS